MITQRMSLRTEVIYSDDLTHPVQPKLKLIKRR